MTHEVRLYLYIDKTGYRLARIHPVEGNPAKGWTLTKKDGEVYQVHRDDWGLHCSCGDFTWRKANSDRLCKHLMALQEKGLI